MKLNLRSRVSLWLLFVLVVAASLWFNWAVAEARYGTSFWRWISGW